MKQLVIHRQDVVNPSHPRFGDGIFVKEIGKGNQRRYFVRWPLATNGIRAGWYFPKDLIVMG